MNSQSKQRETREGAPPTDPRRIIGALGEELAAQLLWRRGWDILERNWRTARGEIDLIVRRRTTIAAVEVKTRRTHDFGHPSEAVTAVKLQRLRQLVSAWAHERQPPHVDTLRVDVVAVTWSPQRTLAELEHLATTQAVAQGVAPAGLTLEHIEGAWR
ncbi:YraN family protein [Micrococcales bacterium 31B]|nr:YraN family protein [Micrococcales bacterium 31B]